MATNTAGTAARQLPFQAVHYLRRNITKADAGLTLTIGTIPARAVVLRGGVVVTEAFNAGTNNRLDLGTAADTDGFATLLALGTVGVIVADEMATTNDMYSTSDVVIKTVVDVTGTAATTGAGVVWIEYLVDNDL